jgi:predicted Zn-dependent protease
VVTNIDPREPAGFFQLLTEGENASATSIPQVFRSHPATDERIASLNQLGEKSDHQTGFVDLPAEFKKP